MLNIPFVSVDDQDWANEQFDAIAPNQEAIRAFDASEDGARYLAITSMTMWENLGADTLPATAEDDN